MKKDKTYFRPDIFFRYAGFLFLLLCLGIFFPSWAEADAPPATVYVDASYGGGDSDGSEEKPFTTLTEGINLTFDGDTIQIAGGTYTNASQYSITKNLTIQGNSGNPVILQAAADASSATDRVMEIDAIGKTITLKNLTIQYGKKSGAGGAGICLTNGTLSMTNCTVSNNTNSSSTQKGGGIYVNEGATLNMTDCTVADNTAVGEGGGIAAVGSGSEFSRVSPIITLTNCTISGNQTSGSQKSGGGIFQTIYAELSMTNCTISGNTATKYGGGIYSGNAGDSVTLMNCTFSGNTATSEGGGLYCKAGMTPTVGNCIFWGNTAISNGQIYANTITGITYSIIQGGNAGTFTGAGNLFTDPNLVALADNGGSTQTCAIPNNSSAVNQGTAAGAPTTDQRGASRADGIDMGAYEYVTARTVYVDASAPNNDGDGTEDNPYQKLETAITAAFPGDTIQIAGGTYTNVSGYTVYKNLTITGSTESPVILQAAENVDNATASVLTIGDVDNPGEPTVILENLTIQNGKAAEGGGGINNNFRKNTLVLRGCTIRNNQAFTGGGILNKGTATITNCTFSGNSATLGGGLTDFATGTSVITNCTFSENSATTSEGVAGSGGGVYGAGNTTIANTIFWGNTASTEGTSQIGVEAEVDFRAHSNRMDNGGGTVTVVSSVIQNGDGTAFPGEGNLFTDPNLGALGDNGGPTQTYALGTGSSALNAGLSVGNHAINPVRTSNTNSRKDDSGTTITVPATDQRGESRPKGSAVDMGAVEIEPAPAPTSAPGPGPDPEPTTAPTAAPTKAPTAAPTPEPTPVPVQPVDPPVIPTDTPLPDNTEPEIAVPLIVTIPSNASPEEKKDALREALREALVPGERIESIVELLDIDDTGQVYITPDGMDQLRELLEDLEIPEGAENGPLAVFKASLGGNSSGMRLAGNDKTAVLFFLLPEGFVGKTADRVHVVKMLASNEAVPFTQVFTMEDLKDTCSAVAEMEHIAGGDVLKRLLASKDLVTKDCRVALAIMDGGSFDLDGMVNDSVTDPAFVIEAEEKENPDPEPSGSASGGGTGGCNTGFVPLAMLLLGLPLILLRK